MKAVLILLLCFVALTYGQTKRTYIDFNFNKLFDGGVTAPTKGTLTTTLVNYEFGDGFFEGFLAVSSNGSAALRPGVLLLPDDDGLTAFERNQAAAWANAGYVVFAADLYGKGVRPTEQTAISGNATFLKTNLPLLQNIVATALSALRNQPQTDNNRLAIVGYGIGGTGALEANRAGLSVSAVAAVSPDLSVFSVPLAGAFKASTLIVLGSLDPTASGFAPGYTNDLTNRKADWQLTYQGNAAYGFSNPTSTTYNALAASRADAAVKTLLQQKFNA